MKKKLYHQFVCSSLMLPEHRARLARHRQKSAREACRGKFAPADEQQLEQFQRLMEQSMHSGLPLKVIVVDNGSCRTFTGVILERQPDPARLRLHSGDRVITVPVAAIVHLEAALI